MKCQTEINHDNVMHFHHIQKQSSGGVLLNFVKLTGEFCEIAKNTYF